MRFVHQRIIFQGEKRPNFFQMPMVRLGGVKYPCFFDDFPNMFSHKIRASCEELHKTLLNSLFEDASKQTQKGELSPLFKLRKSSLLRGGPDEKYGKKK